MGLTRQAMLACVPRRSPGVEETRDADGRVLLTVRRSEQGLTAFLSLFLAIPRKRTFQLDEKGEWFWQACDGSRSVEELGAEFSRRWEVGREAARKTAFDYLGLLLRRGLVQIETPRPGGKPARGKEKKRK